MFADIDADWYVMVDGDATYDASAHARLVETAIAGRARHRQRRPRRDREDGLSARGHRLGQPLLTGLVGAIFGSRTRGHAFRLQVLQPALREDLPRHELRFEIETELMIHALELRLPVAEISAPYGERPEGSASKLSTYRDGLVILSLIGLLVQRERPLEFFSALAGLLVLLALFLGVPVVWTFLETGLVPRLPTALLAASLMLSALLSFAVGLILQAVALGRREMKRLVYLGFPAGAAQPGSTRAP
jgi:hypothetical protein